MRIPLWLIVSLLAVFGVYSCATSEWFKESLRKEAQESAAEARRLRTPRLVSEADGCKVYTFNPGDRWHYFTRCAAQTTTDTSYERCSGSGKHKTCETRTEQIVNVNEVRK